METYDYWDKGVLIIDDFIPESMISQLTLQGEAVRLSQGRTYKPIINIHRHNNIFEKFSKSDKYKDIVMPILKYSNISLLQTQFFFSPPGSPGFKCHQDNSFVRPARENAFLTTWLPLVDISKRNGALFYHPKMHKQGYFERRKAESENLNTNTMLTMQSEEIKLPEENRETIEVKAGSLVLIHGMTPHGSLENSSEENRPVYLSNYIVSGMGFNPGSDNKRVEEPTNWN